MKWWREVEISPFVFKIKTMDINYVHISRFELCENCKKKVEFTSFIGGYRYFNLCPICDNKKYIGTVWKTKQ